MKRILTLLALLPTLTFAQKTLSLNGEWTFWVPEKADKQTVQVPHTYNVMPGLEDYAGEAWYARKLPITPDMKGMQLRVHFNGVYHDAIVFVNDKLVGEHLNAGYTPFSMDITPYVDVDTENEIKVKCNNSYTEENLPWKRKFDWANDGGIYRDVSLHATGRYSLRYVHVTPNINLADSTATARFDIRLFEPKVKKAVIKLMVIENTTQHIVYEGQQLLTINKEGTFSCNIDCGKVKLWHFDDPNLYTFEAELFDGKKLSDVKREHFGFRTFGIEGNRFVLNGEPVRLPGIENMPGSNPDFGMAESKEYMGKTIGMMKRLNCTFSRYHWAQDEYRLHLMDSLGIMVQEEISWWQGPSSQLSPSLRETARRQLTELIEAHYNHPCIWGWGMSNEVRDNVEEAKMMAEHARSLDSTRIIDVICNHMWELFENDPSLALDLPTWNEYIGTWHAKHRDQTAGYFEQIEPILNGRPLLISEAGLCEPVFTGGDARRVDEMIYHITEWKRHDFVCGYIYFCLEDYRTQMGEEGLGKDRIRRHGVCDKRLNPKASFDILRQIMCPIEVTKVKPAGQKENVGTLANLYDVDALNHDAEITLQVKHDIPSYNLRGYRILYVDAKGLTQFLSLPNLNPGDSYSFVMKDVNSGFNFDIIRKDGTSVLKY
jgi:beta-glucuronidase